MSIIDLLRFHFSYIEAKLDKRQQSKIKYQMQDILIIIVLGILAGYDTINSMSSFVLTKLNDLKTLELIKNNQQPDENTYYRMLKEVKWTELKDLSLKIYQSLPNNIKEELSTNFISIVIDGKFIRGNKTRTEEKTYRGVDIVSAYDTKKRIILTQRNVFADCTTDNKDCEKDAIRDLVKELESSSFISIDAIACDKQTLKILNNAKVYYVISLKDNNTKLFYNAKEMFEQAKIDHHFNKLNTFEFEPIKQSGKWIQRSYRKISYYDNHLWDTYVWDELVKNTGILSIIEETKVIITPTSKTVETYYFVSNLLNIEKIANIQREHWAIESYHWSLDKTLFEDQCIIKDVNATTVLNIFRKLILLILSLPIIPQYNKKHEPIANKNKLKMIFANFTDYLTLQL